MSIILIGIDGGGTKTAVLVRRSHSDEILFSKNYPETNHQSVGTASVYAVFSQMLLDIESALEEPISGASAVMGMAGIDRASDERLYEGLFHDAGFHGKVSAYNDAYTALVGAHGKREGAIVICGTGSIALGIGAKGEIIRSGGWGALISDEGSGYRLGIEAISAVFRAYDGSGERTALTGAVLSHFLLRDVPPLVDVIYSEGELPVRRVASLAPIVIESAALDAVGRAIVDRELDRLMDVIAGLSSRMGHADFPLAVAGSLLLKSEPYRTGFIRRVSARFPEIDVRMPLFTAAEGALLLAKDID